MTIADMAIADCARPRVRPDHALAHNTSALLRSPRRSSMRRMTRGSHTSTPRSSRSSRSRSSSRPSVPPSTRRRLRRSRLFRLRASSPTPRATRCAAPPPPRPPPRRHLMHRLQNLPRPSMTCLGSERDMTPALHTHTCSVSLISSSLTRSPFACLPGPASLAAGQAAPRRGCRCRRGIPR